MKKLINHLNKGLNFKHFILIAFLFVGFSGFGQAHFTESFENPDSWSGYTTGTVNFDSGDWDFVEVFPESSGDSYDGSKACRINDDEAGASITSPSLNTVGTVSFYYHRPFGGTGSFELQKSVGGGAYTTLATVVYTSVTSPTFYTYDVNDASNNIKIRIVNDDNTAHLTIDYITIGTYSSGINDPTSFTATASSISQIDLSWSQNSNTDDVMIVYNTTGTFTDPVDGTSYSVSSSACGGTVIYNQSGASFNHTSLSSGTQYFYKAWSVDGSDNYSMGVTDDATTLKAEPSNHASSFTATENGHNQIDLSWNDNDGTQAADGFIIKANTSGTFTDPSDATDPTEDSDLSDGTALVKVTHGTQAYSFTGLSASTQYYFKIWTYTNSGTDIDFKTNGTVPTANATTDAPPSIVPPSVGDVYITEVSDASNYNNEFIELYNVTNNIIDLSDCKLVMNLSTNFQLSTYTGDIQIPVNGFIIIARGATLAGFESEWGTLPANTNFNEGSGNMYLGTGTARRWQLVYDDGTKAETVIDDSQNTVGGSGNSSVQETPGNWTTNSSNNATPGALESGDQETLPIELTSFTAEKQDYYNLINWVTAVEENNAFFTLEKSFNAKDFFEIDNIKGAGSSKSTNYYQSKDFNTDNDIIYYRLKQTDFDGASTYSDVISIENDSELVLINNFFNGNEYIINLISANYSNINIKLFDINGRLILSESEKLNKGNNNYKFNIDNISAGVYILKIQNNTEVINTKVINN